MKTWGVAESSSHGSRSPRHWWRRQRVGPPRRRPRAALFLEDGQLLQKQHLQEAVRTGRRETPGEPRTLREKLETLERREIEAALERHEGNLSAVARDLEIGRSTLYRRIKELEIELGEE